MVELVTLDPPRVRVMQVDALSGAGQVSGELDSAAGTAVQMRLRFLTCRRDHDDLGCVPGCQRPQVRHHAP
jgi:hypothetical protein